MGATMVQLNTRIPVELKEQGDLALAKAGYTPSQAVRALWEFAAAHVHEPKVVRKALQEETEEQLSSGVEKIDPFVQWEETAHELYRKMGISLDAAITPIPYEELKELAYLERAEKFGL